MLQSIEKSILQRIRTTYAKRIFSPSDFALLGSRAAIDLTLHRLQQSKQIRRIMRGLYFCPRHSALLGQELSPDIDEIAQALARKFGWRIYPCGEVALNLLGLSTQVPSQFHYLTDGPNRQYRIGKTTLEFKHTALKEAGFELRESGMIVQALRSLGQERITPSILKQIRTWLNPKLRSKVLEDTRTVAGWIYAAIKTICS